MNFGSILMGNFNVCGQIQLSRDQIQTSLSIAFEFNPPTHFYRILQ